MSFKRLLYEWHQSVERNLPWKETKDPFFIWLSEVILQQTRVEQGIPYYLRFRARYANVAELANSSDEELMKLWEGLGYYSRARNLHKAAKQIVESGGQFPSTYEDLLALPGIGPYTASAIASFAYDLPTPVIDGNVNRVIARFFGISTPIDTLPGQKEIREILDKVFDVEYPARFNQAIMDFGAIQCKPKNPDCLICPFSDVCVAFAESQVNVLPMKAKKIKKKERTIRYAVLLVENQVVIKKRVDKDIWRHLHDFVELETVDLREIETLTYKKGEQIRIDGPYKHILTHRNLTIYFHIIEIQDLKIENGSPYFLVERKNLRKFAFPKIIDWYLNEKSIS